jgi:glyoxylase I family protein
MDIHGVCPLIEVFDMPTAIRFYRDVLGFTIVDRSQPSDDCNWSWLRLNEAEIMLNTAYEKEYRPAAPDPARVAAHKDTCLFFGCKDLDGAYQHLRGHGVTLKEPKVAPYGMKQLWFTDPDGFGLCFQWPVSKESQQRWEQEYGLKPEALA